MLRPLPSLSSPVLVRVCGSDSHPPGHREQRAPRARFLLSSAPPWRALQQRFHARGRRGSWLRSSSGVLDEKKEFWFVIKCGSRWFKVAQGWLKDILKQSYNFVASDVLDNIDMCIAVPGILLHSDIDKVGESSERAITKSTRECSMSPCACA